jgi:serine/threonine protein kinase
MIVMKYYQLGSFYELVHKKTNHIPENKWNPKFIMSVAHDIACGLMDMHAVGLVHCDIKPGNIFLEREANGELKAVVGDLGVATAVDESLLRVKAFRESRIRGASVAYAPPEVLRAFKDNDDADLLDPQIAKASDVYAYSMVIHEALTRKLVWDKLGNDQIERLVLSGQRPKIPKSIQERRERDTVLDLLCTIMSSAWAQFPKDRPTFTQIVKDLNRMKSNVVVSKKAKKNEDA